MKKKILLSILGTMIFGLSYAQDRDTNTQNETVEYNNSPSNDSDWELDTDTQEETDSIHSETGSNINLDQLPESENDTTTYNLPEKTESNDVGYFVPPASGSSNPGPSGGGAYDVDGLVNGKTDRQ